MITVERSGNGCDIATIRAPLAFNMLVLVWRVVANVIGGRDSRSDMTSTLKSDMTSTLKNETSIYKE